MYSVCKVQSEVDTIEQLQIKLTNFAKIYQLDINGDPAFQQHVYKFVLRQVLIH